jgi:hypothetical protein
MNRSILILALLAITTLAACDRKPTVIAVPAAPVAVPGPAGPQGATGAQGGQGTTGKSGDGTTVIVMPPASGPAN